MVTDAGTIPQILWTLPGFSPWEFGPAYIIHDWEFRSRACHKLKKSFFDVNQTLMEGIKTLMESGHCEKNLTAFRLISYSLHTAIAKKRLAAIECDEIPKHVQF